MVGRGMEGRKDNGRDMEGRSMEEGRRWWVERSVEYGRGWWRKLVEEGSMEEMGEDGGEGRQLCSNVREIHCRGLC